MSRHVAFLVSLALLLGLVACGDADPGGDRAATPAEQGRPTASGGTVYGGPAEARPGGGAPTDGAGPAMIGADPCAAKACSGTCPDCAQASEGPACACAEGKAGAPVWCKACDKGYVDGKEVCCENCVKDALKKASKAGAE